jgi:hypothetical protein
MVLWLSDVKRSLRWATNKIPDSCRNFYSLLHCVVVAARPERSVPKVNAEGPPEQRMASITF